LRRCIFPLKYQRVEAGLVTLLRGLDTVPLDNVRINQFDDGPGNTTLVQAGLSDQDAEGYAGACWFLPSVGMPDDPVEDSSLSPGERGFHLIEQVVRVHCVISLQAF